MENRKGQRGLLWQDQSECAEEAPHTTNVRIIIIVISSAETNFQEPVAAILVATTAATTSFVIMKPQHDGCQQELGATPTN